MPVRVRIPLLLIAFLGGCALPRPWLAPTAAQACKTGELNEGDAILVLSLRMPDCRNGRFAWTYYRSDQPTYSTANPEAQSSLVDPLEWSAELDRRITAAGRPPVIYIHGYFNGQDDALRRALGIRAILCPRGTEPAMSAIAGCQPARPVVALTWPSHNNFAKYTWDEANAEWVVERAVAQVLTIARKYPGTILVAHSMGNRILVAAARAAEREPALFGQLVLGSPDVDRAQIAQLLERESGFGPFATIYASRKDQALSASWRTHGYPRAGDLSNWVSGRRPGYPYRTFNRADIVDTSAVSAGPVAHAAFIQTAEGAADLCHVLAGDAAKPGRAPDPHFPPYQVLVRKPAGPDDCRPLAKAAARIARGKEWAGLILDARPAKVDGKGANR